ncbi:MAG: 50S ribosomal protein L20 [Candidatus Eisenbacteria bacterium]|nr:50S ribosomal protein L20 [Candidatus Eisenbacteria bacterium]
MPRAKTVVPGRAKRRKVLKQTKGNFGGRSRLYQTARETLFRALRYSYEHRRTKKREFRALWIQRINAAARMNGITYNALIHGLRLANVEIDRKILAELAVKDAAGFTQLVEVARSAHA